MFVQFALKQIMLSLSLFCLKKKKFFIGKKNKINSIAYRCPDLHSQPGSCPVVVELGVGRSPLAATLSLNTLSCGGSARDRTIYVRKITRNPAPSPASAQLSVVSWRSLSRRWTLGADGHPRVMLVKQLLHDAALNRDLEFPVGGLSASHLQRLSPRGRLATCGDIFGYDKWGRSETGTQWVEARDAAKCPVMHVAAPMNFHINSAKIEKPKPKTYLWKCSPCS